jgi:hypothetical protein
VESAPRAYRLKASNAAPPISTFPGAIPPPERSRTRLPIRNEGAAWFCIAVFDGSEVEKAGANGVLSTSVAAIAIVACFVDANILISIALASSLITMIRALGLITVAPRRLSFRQSLGRLCCREQLLLFLQRRHRDQLCLSLDP